MSIGRRDRQRGLGLVELLVGIVIGLIVMAGTIFVFIGNSESSLLYMRSTRVIQQARDTMDRLVQDVRRSGYLGYRYMATTDVLPDANPFNRYDPANTMTVAIAGQNSDGTVCTTGVCRGITYAYNLDDDGGALVGSVRQQPTVGQGAGTLCDANNFDTSNNELFGFRFVESGGDGWIEMRTTTAGECTTAGGTWTPITDPRLIRIGDLNGGATAEDRVGFVLLDECVGLLDVVGPSSPEPDGDVFTDTNGDGALTCADLTNLEPGDFQVRTRRVQIQLRGWSKRDPAVTFKLTQVVDLPNHAARFVSP